MRKGVTTVPYINPEEKKALKALAFVVGLYLSLYIIAEVCESIFL